MKLLAQLGLVVLVALSVLGHTTTTSALSVEGRIRALEEGAREDKQKMEQKIAALEAKLNATSTLPAGALLTFVDGRTACPEGTVEANITQGMMLVGRPKNGKTGAVFNRPLEPGETGRTPAHSHAVSVNDLGHTHVGVVNDPGHAHHYGHLQATATSSSMCCSHGGYYFPTKYDFPTTTNKTGITVDNLSAKSSIEVSIDTNGAGEHYPLLYVLLCQKLA